MRGCSLHFTAEDYFRADRIKRRVLKLNAVPTQNHPLASEPTPGTSGREERAKKKHQQEEAPKPSCSGECEYVNEDEINNSDISAAAKGLLLLMNGGHTHTSDKVSPSSTRDAEVQVNTPKVETVCELIKTDGELKHFAGINNFQIFNCIVNVFEKYHKDKKVHRLNCRQRIMLVLVKLKTSLPYVTLAFLFSISPVLCKTYICDTIPILSDILKPLIYFPPKEEILQNMPICFSNFQNVRVVLDCTEIYIQTPKCLCCRIRFYSQYKSHMTLKFMTGVSPAGLITFVSKPYGGRASDKVIFEGSKVINLLEPHRDAIMVDKGFRIDNICDLHNIKLIQPPFLKNKAQLSSEEAIIIAKIASARVHIERSNQRLKIF
ncbi:uncharacterized protein LOC126880730 [Diabrotica virgifera virgifera]|uniref:DDE Tnp4 domain-containing protein n=1 Tax=Diabrotica virgifera virgifera TaxID=50390 RepID=A0ABM5JS29_DIAVI|nr:uncharacterized protein LOC126880730 [Diabrotica virgifera virgifera]